MQIERNELEERFYQATLGTPFLVQSNNETFRITIEKDKTPQNPRLAKHDSHLLLWHKTLPLGDKNEFPTMEAAFHSLQTPETAPLPWYASWDNMTVLEKIAHLCTRNTLVLLPVYASGCDSLVLEGTRSSWDSSILGFIYEERKMEKGKDFDWNWKQSATKRLQDEIDQYSAFITGKMLSLRIDRWHGRSYDKEFLIQNSPMTVYINNFRSAVHSGMILHHTLNGTEVLCAVSGGYDPLPLEDYKKTWVAYKEYADSINDIPERQIMDDTCFRHVTERHNIIDCIEKSMSDMLDFTLMNI